MKAHWSAYIYDLPGAGMRMPYRCIYDDCGMGSFSSKNIRTPTVASVVMHLNDYHKLSREQIADWLDKLHDDELVDLTFKEA